MIQGRLLGRAAESLNKPVWQQHSIAIAPRPLDCCMSSIWPCADISQEAVWYLGGVATDEVVHGLLSGEFADRGQHPKGITTQQDEVLGVRAHAWNPGVVNVVNGVGSPGVLCHSAAAKQCKSQHHVQMHIWQSLWFARQQSQVRFVCDMAV